MQEPGNEPVTGDPKRESLNQPGKCSPKHRRMDKETSEPEVAWLFHHLQVKPNQTSPLNPLSLQGRGNLTQNCWAYLKLPLKVLCIASQGQSLFSGLGGLQRALPQVAGQYGISGTWASLMRYESASEVCTCNQCEMWTWEDVTEQMGNSMVRTKTLNKSFCPGPSERPLSQRAFGKCKHILWWQ